jgi:uncharacterized protein
VTNSLIKNPSGERIDLTFHPAKRKDTIVIFGHGLTGNKDRPLLTGLAENLSARGWPCMRISFSGNGFSDGRFEQSTITKQTADLATILSSVPDWVQVAYAGHSMGAAVGLLTAARDLRIRLLISLAGMARTADFVKREFGHLTPGEDCMWEERDCPLSAEFVEDLAAIGDVLPAAASVIQPLLAIHGTADDVIPPDDSRAVYQAVPGRKRLLEIDGAGHSFEETHWPVIVDAMDEWLTMNFGPA